MPRMTADGATARFNRLVQKRMAQGMTRTQAIRQTAKANPKLHGLMLLEANADKSKTVKNSIRAQHGFAAK